MKENNETKRILQTLLVRQALTDEKANNAKASLSGIKGEAEFAHWLQLYGQFENITMRNLYLDFKRLCEMDFIIFSKNRWTTCEIKNTQGDIMIDGIQFTVNGKAWANHPMIQTRRATEILQDIARNMNAQVKIEPVLIYMNEHAHVKYFGSDDDHFNPTVLSRGQVRNYIFNLKNELQYQHYNAYNLEQLKQQILQYHSPSSYLDEYYKDIQYDQILRGMNCPHCRNYKLTLNYRTGKCHNCGKTSWKNMLLAHTIQEFQDIYRSTLLSASQIDQFIGGGISKRLIIDHLQKNHQVATKYSKKYYLGSSQD